MYEVVLSRKPLEVEIDDVDEKYACEKCRVSVDKKGFRTVVTIDFPVVVNCPVKNELPLFVMFPTKAAPGMVIPGRAS